MKICVTGANGFVGEGLCSSLIHAGQDVVRVGRNISPGCVGVGDIGSQTDWRMTLEGCDAVVHLAARVDAMQDRVADSLAEFRRTNVDGTRNLARQAALIGVKRFVFLSSIKVLGEGRDAAYQADDIPRPIDAYANSKWEAEKELQVIAAETGMEIVIIRPPLVYGPGVKGNFAALVRWIRKGLPLPLGAIHNKRSLIALDNLVDFIILCADRERSPHAANEIFLVSDGEDLSTTELLRKIARAYGAPDRLLSAPEALLSIGARLIGKSALAQRLLGSLVVDATKARNLLGWRPVVTIDEQLLKMARHATAV